MFLTFTILVSIVTVPVDAFASAKPVVFDDPSSMGGPGDFEAIRVDDNGSHLIIHGLWNESLSSTGSTSFVVQQMFYTITIDNDSDPGTGRLYQYDSFAVGADIVVKALADTHGTRSLVMVFYYPNGVRARTIFNNSYLVYNSSGMYVELPLDALNISLDTEMRIVVTPKLMIFDHYSPSHFGNITVNYTNVVVDGDPSEWDPGSTLLTVDQGDSYSLDYPGINATSLYVATDDNFLYFLVELEEPVNHSFYSSNPGDYIDEAVPHSFLVSLDVDNDNVFDYIVFFYSSGRVSVNNLSSHVIHWYSDFPSAWDTDSLELGVSLDSIGLTALSGNNITMVVSYLESRLYDRLSDKTMEYGFVYKPSVGGKHVILAENYCPSLGCTVANTTIVAGDLNLTVNTTSILQLFVAGFNESPVLRRAHTSIIGGYYKFFVDDPNDVIWPVRVSLHYNDSVLEAVGVDESQLRIYYYNDTLDAYTPLSLSGISVDTADNIVYFNVSRELYDAGDPIILLGGSPPVGGELVMYTGDNGGWLFIGLLVFSTLSATGILVYKWIKRLWRD